MPVLQRRGMPPGLLTHVNRQRVPAGLAALLHLRVTQMEPLASTNNKSTVREIEDKLADLKARWPAHSVPPSMCQRLEELEKARQADNAR